MAGGALDFVFPHVDITSPRIERSHNLASEAADESTDFEQRHRRDRLLQHFGQRFYCGQPDAQSSKRSRSRPHGKGADVMLGVSVVGEKFGNLWHELRGKSAAT